MVLSKGMSHVQLTGDVWRRHHDGKWFLAAVYFCMKIFIVFPLSGKDGLRSLLDHRSLLILSFCLSFQNMNSLCKNSQTENHPLTCCNPTKMYPLSYKYMIPYELKKPSTCNLHVKGESTRYHLHFISSVSFELHSNNYHLLLTKKLKVQLRRR